MTRPQTQQRPRLSTRAFWFYLRSSVPSTLLRTWFVGVQLFSALLLDPIHHAVVLVTERDRQAVGDVLEHLAEISTKRIDDEKFPLIVAIREEQDLLAVRRPRGRDVVNDFAQKDVLNRIVIRDADRDALRAVGIDRVQLLAVVG